MLALAAARSARLASTAARSARLARVAQRSAHSGLPSICSLHEYDVTVGEPAITLVSKLSIEIEEHQSWACVGPNGSGKTTTSQLLAELATCGEHDADGKLAAHISFDSHRRLLRNETRAFRDSRFGTIHKRATPASYLYPHLCPTDPEGGTVGLPTASGYKGYRPKRTRLSPLPVRYDAEGDDPLLGELEHAACTGEGGAMLRALNLLEARHRPLHVLSTGQLRKVQLAACLLSPPRLLLLDEALDGLDAASRLVAMDAVASAAADGCTVVMVAHRREDLPVVPTHALMLGLGGDGTGWAAGRWEALADAVGAFFEARREEPTSPLPMSPSPQQPEAGEEGGVTTPPPGDPLVEFNGVCVRYGETSTVFDPPLHWTVREGENWAVVGGNGSGKTTLVDLISGENVLGYTQDIRLFGRRKGSGESIWSIKSQLGVISNASHMEYADYADPAVIALSRQNAFARSDAIVSTWDVVCSGFFDSVGLYATPSPAQTEAAREWVERFGLEDLVQPPPRKRPVLSSRLTASMAGDVGDTYAAAAAAAAAALATSEGGRNFFHLSFGQQKLVLLCRAVVKRPRLLLLDEPTHGLSSSNRQRLLGMLATLAADPTVAIVHVTHRQDEIDALGFKQVLRLSE